MKNDENFLNNYTKIIIFLYNYTKKISYGVVLVILHKNIFVQNSQKLIEKFVENGEFFVKLYKLL